MEKGKGNSPPQGGAEQNWSEAVEDLLTAGDTEGAISLLETLVSKLETQPSSEAMNLQLASALTETAKLYSSKGLSLKSDELLSRASLIKLRALPSGDVKDAKRELNEDKASKCNAATPQSDSGRDGSSTEGHLEENLKLQDEASFGNGSSDDDWEAIADREPSELLSSQCSPGVSDVPSVDTNVQAPKRRGRGTFSYKKQELYSDRQSSTSLIDDVKDEASSNSNEQDTDSRHSEYGTRHVLVLTDFSPSTRTTELEKLFDDFKDHGVVIRWVNDTTALAVFRTPSVALEACNRIQCPFTVSILDEDDTLLGSIPRRDLEPPRPRPKTSVRTAQRLIAQGMGLKLPSTAFGSRELKTQEEARKNRIVSRQKMIDDAWGGEDDKLR